MAKFCMAVLLLSSAVWPFLSTNISLGSVEMHLRGGGIVYYHFTTNQLLLASLSVKKF